MARPLMKIPVSREGGVVALPVNNLTDAERRSYFNGKESHEIVPYLNWACGEINDLVAASEILEEMAGEEE